VNKNNNYNSILFLTTLSVYLGLVLVSGSAPVLAQAAMTRDFDIKNEIIFEDDLDKKPDEDLFVSSLVELVNELNKFSEKGVFDWNIKHEYQLDGLSFCESDNSPSFIEPSPSESIFYIESSLEKQQVYKKIDERFVSIARNLFKQATNLELGDFHSHKFDLTLTFDQRNLDIKANVKTGNGKNAQTFADSLTNYLTYTVSNSISAKEKIVAENTKIIFENNQVFIVTRLPRASIDALLAEQKDAR